MFIENHHQGIPKNPFEKALYLQRMLIAIAENGNMDEGEYAKLRRELLNEVDSSLVPKIIKTCRDQKTVWGYLTTIASGAGSWKKRRTHIYNSFIPLLDYLESNTEIPSDDAITGVLSAIDMQGVHYAWRKALKRRHEDPEGAITASRTLLETVCKHILDEADIHYSSDELPKLYKKTAEILNLAPSQHTEQVFKSILGGCHTVVQNLGTLRNKIGDAHGKGKNPVRPLSRHAALAVNLSGSLATFLIETWNAQKN